MIFNTILQKHNISFTTTKCNIGSNGSVAAGNAGGETLLSAISIHNCLLLPGELQEGTKIDFNIFVLLTLFKNQESDHSFKHLWIVIFFSNTKLLALTSHQ